MIDTYAAALDESERQGYSGLLVNADMAWAVHEPEFESLFEFETDANRHRCIERSQDRGRLEQ